MSEEKVLTRELVWDIGDTMTGYSEFTRLDRCAIGPLGGLCRWLDLSGLREFSDYAAV